MKKSKGTLTEEEIDEIVIRQADDESAWGKLVHVKAMSVVSIALSPKLIEKAKVIARRRATTDGQHVARLRICWTKQILLVKYKTFKR